MTNPNIRIKRSAVEGKRPEISQLEFGELALNTNDGRLFARKYNVGIGSTVTLLNVWTENIGGGAYYNEGNVGIGTTNPTSKLSVVGDGNFTGVVTATTFFGALTGTATTASSVTANSVGLGTHTYGDYVKDITGTANQITVTSGTGEGSSPTLSIPNQFTAPQDITVTRDLQVNRNLNVNGNITIGGTSATLFTTEFKVYDPDIVLGFRTDGSNNDISTDNTANHGGIAIASTEGTPLISLYDVGIGETNPSTYKKFMWFKSGTFSGLGTDAWISNYAIGIGSTQVPNGVRLAAGAIHVLDNKLNVHGDIDFSGTFYQNGNPFVASRWSVGTGDNIYRLNGNVGIGTTNSTSKLHVIGDGYFTGVVTASSFSGGPLSGSSGTFTSLNVTGITTANTFDIGIDAGISTTRTVVATTSPTAIESFSASTYRSARVQVQITQGTSYQASDILIIHDGTTANLIEYGSIATGSYLGNFTADINSGNARLLISMGTSTSATVKVLTQKIKV